MMGVLNCTPDSFSDGAPLDVADRVRKAERMLEQGASILDVGGESTRPGATPVRLEDELSRVIPVIRALPKKAVISIDTMKAEVMRQAIAAGASMVNDVSALRFDDESMRVVAEHGVSVCLMHMQGTPQTMQKSPAYDDVLQAVIHFFSERVEACLAAGIARSAIILDPGIGFGKRLEDNLTLIANISHIKKTFGLPVLLGVSRKSCLGQITGAGVHDREVETAVASAAGIMGGADMVRVHDCAMQYKAVQVASQLADHQRQEVAA